MYFKQFYLGCLAQASYMIGSEGEAAVVDPRRDVDEYIDEAKRQGLVIRHVIETHLHADFVSGHRELALRTGAKIYFGARANAGVDHVSVRDGDEIAFGTVTLRFLETPGHTPESVCILVTDRSESAEPQAVLTGDTLFIGDVGRPDLLGAAMTAQELAGMLYDSIHEKLLTLPDAVAVYPGHGAGSLCGKNLSSEKSSTIGEQRRFNYALKAPTREEFVSSVTADLPEAPAYFRRDVEMNRAGVGSLSEMPPLAGMTADAAASAASRGAVFLDVRTAEAYAAGHVPGSFHVGLSGQFATWCGTVLPPGRPLLLVAADRAAAEEARMRLTRVGIENVEGFLEGGVDAWVASGRPAATTEQIDVAELRRRLSESAGRPPMVLDVRRDAEREAGRIGPSLASPLHELAGRVLDLDRERSVAAICAGGYRSSIAVSLLERAGFHRLADVAGGMTAWTSAGFETVPEAPESAAGGAVKA